METLLENKTQAERLVEQILTMDYGDVITHHQIESIINEKYATPKYASIIAQARRILTKRGVYLESIRGEGYRLVEPDNVVDFSLRHYKRGFNEMQKGYDVLTNAPTQHMSPEGLQIYRRVNDRAVTLAAAMHGVSAELKILSKRQHPMTVERIRRR